MIPLHQDIEERLEEPQVVDKPKDFIPIVDKVKRSERVKTKVQEQRLEQFYEFTSIDKKRSAGKKGHKDETTLIYTSLYTNGNSSYLLIQVLADCETKARLNNKTILWVTSVENTRIYNT